MHNHQNCCPHPELEALSLRGKNTTETHFGSVTLIGLVVPRVQKRSTVQRLLQTLLNDHVIKITLVPLQQLLRKKNKNRARAEAGIQLKSEYSMINENLQFAEEKSGLYWGFGREVLLWLKCWVAPTSLCVEPTCSVMLCCAAVPLRDQICGHTMI